jgi:hypothetical protein
MERAKDFEELESYEEVLNAYDKATKLEADNFSAWLNKSIFL